MPFDGQPDPPALVTAEHVSHIGARSDVVLRNLQITQSYHDLGVAIAARLGPRDACWASFAVWASRTAGRFIRGEWLADPLRRVLARMSPGGSRRAGLLMGLDERIASHLAEGNRKVYAEIAPLFVELVRLLDLPASERPAALDRSLATLRPGAVEHDGQAALRRALRAFVEAAALPEGPARAQQVLLGNLLIGAHEQYRLQAQIEGALDVVGRLRPSFRDARLGGAWRRLEARLRQHVTHAMVRLDLPGLSVSVGRDVPALPDGSMFPADLRFVSHPELRAVLARFDRTPDTTHGSAALDWGDYGDRMNYVVDLFRSRQQLPVLAHPPFEPRQAAAIRAGYVPAGRL